ncbi:gamma-glutamyltransferase [Thiobacillus sp.]|uniref:gamma-glutamyltransferase n=1 Tax=Thiobacillus sp. TaxID=924 RepID=UPI0025EAD445|nr:gamma-glutamyltransferase [Thiobacillus sp.]
MIRIARWFIFCLLSSSVLAASSEGVVAVSQPAAAAAGARILAQGGNAIDAAAAVQFALNVVEPQSSGIGGGGFMLVHLAKTGETYFVDSRERAPARARADMFAPDGLPMSFPLASTSGLSVGVPGTLLGVDTALRRWGTMKLSATLAPAIELAEHGFRVNRFLADDIANDDGRTRIQPETAATFRPGGVPLAEGDWLVQPDLAKTLKLIAAEGPDAFYRGPIARAIVKAQQRGRSELGDAGKGRMTLADLTQYRVAIRRPLVGHYRGWTLAGMPPPSSGGLTLFEILKLLERFPLGDVAQGYGFGSPKTLHVMIEAMRLAFADRAVWIGDDDAAPAAQRVLLNPEYLATRAALIKTDRRMDTPQAGDLTPWSAPAAMRPKPARTHEESLHTTHFAIVDRWGNMVSYTTTIEYTWGSGITVPGYGFLLNNELTDFNFLPSADPTEGNPGANDVAPFKRPRSSMAPLLLLKDGKPVAAYGSPGGATIINSVLNVTLNLIDHGMTMQQAIDAPRLSVTNAAGKVSCEGGQTFMQPPFSLVTQDALRTLGHTGLGEAGTDGCRETIGSVQAVVVDPETGTHGGAADPRREGTVIRVGR